MADRGRGRVQGVRSICGRVGPAGRRGRQRAALAFAEVDLAGWCRGAGAGFRRWRSAARCRVGFDLAGDLDEDPALGRLGDQVEGQQGRTPNGVRAWGAGRGRASPSIRFFEERALTVKSPILEALGQPAPAGRRRSRRRTGPGCRRRARRPTEGLIVIPSGSVTTAALRICEGAPWSGSRKPWSCRRRGRSQSRSARRRGGLVSGRPRQAVRSGRSGQPSRRRAPVAALSTAAGLLPGVGADREGKRPFAGGRQGQVGHGCGRPPVATGHLAQREARAPPR